MEGSIICARGCPSLLVALLTWWGPPGYYWLSSGQLDNCIHMYFTPPPPPLPPPTTVARGHGAHSNYEQKSCVVEWFIPDPAMNFLNSFWSGLGSSKRKNNQPRAVDPDPRGKNISNKNRKNTRKLVKTASLFNSIIHCFLLLSNLLCLLKLKRTLHNLFIMLFCKKKFTVGSRSAFLKQLGPDPHSENCWIRIRK